MKAIGQKLLSKKAEIDKRLNIARRLWTAVCQVSPHKEAGQVNL